MSKSIKEQIDEALDNIKTLEHTAQKSVNGIEKNAEHADDFISEIYGEKNENGQRSGDGWQHKVETDIKAKEEEIAKLLDDATVAGLAQSFQKYEESFTRAVENYTRLFVASIVLVFIIGALSILKSPYTNFYEFANLIFYRLPLILPILTLSYV